VASAGDHGGVPRDSGATLDDLDRSESVERAQKKQWDGRLCGVLVADRLSISTDRRRV
jgi:hypothetical protein